MTELTYLYLLSPLHTGGTSQEGNLLGIARESHTDLPYIPSSTIRGRLRASSTNDKDLQYRLFGNELKSDDDSSIVADKLEQGSIWIGDGSIFWLPVPSLSHGVIWISSPLLLQRWARLNTIEAAIPAPYSVTPSIDIERPVYLKDAILKADQLQAWQSWPAFLPQTNEAASIQRALILPDQHCATLIQMSLWRQVKVKLDRHKTVDGGFRYEEAIPPDTLMYFPWGITAKAKDSTTDLKVAFRTVLEKQTILQIGGQESLGRGFVQHWLAAS
jgi:CRISPR-associated protein Cmr4